MDCWLLTREVVAVTDFKLSVEQGLAELRANHFNSPASKARGKNRAESDFRMGSLWDF